MAWSVVGYVYICLHRNMIWNVARKATFLKNKNVTGFSIFSASLVSCTSCKNSQSTFHIHRLGISGYAYCNWYKNKINENILCDTKFSRIYPHIIKTMYYKVINKNKRMKDTSWHSNIPRVILHSEHSVVFLLC